MSTKWTLEMDDVIKRDFNAKPINEIAEYLGLSISKVNHRAYVIGARVPAKAPPQKVLIDRIERMHAEGKTNIEIAASFPHGVTHDRVGYLRSTMGMVAPKNAKLQFWRAWKRSLGWPESLSIRAVQALETFWRLRVPLTRQQLCFCMGVPSKNKNYPRSGQSSGSVMAELEKAGFISRLEVAHKRKSLYFLNAGVIPSDSRSEPFDYEISGDSFRQEGILVPLPARLDFVATKTERGVDQRNHPRGHGNHSSKASGEGEGRRREGRKVHRFANRQRRAGYIATPN